MNREKLMCFSQPWRYILLIFLVFITHCAKFPEGYQQNNTESLFLDFKFYLSENVNRDYYYLIPIRAVYEAEENIYLGPSMNEDDEWKITHFLEIHHDECHLYKPIDQPAVNESLVSYMLANRNEEQKIKAFTPLTKGFHGTIHMDKFINLDKLLPEKLLVNFVATKTKYAQNTAYVFDALDKYIDLDLEYENDRLSVHNGFIHEIKSIPNDLKINNVSVSIVEKGL